jgi:uncharacterized protein YdhG (YjbR/CyaY superfamily)
MCFKCFRCRRKQDMPAKAIDEFLAHLSADKRAALEKLRKTIRAAIPNAEECISYGVPSFRLDGKLLVAYGASAKHCAFYPGAHPIEVHKDELKAYSISKGTVRFPADSPLPVALVRKMVKTRLAQHTVKAS